MSDSRTERTPVDVTLCAKDAWLANKDALSDWSKMSFAERINGVAPPMPWVAIVNALQGAGYFAPQIPPASTIAVPHAPDEIHAFADVACDLEFWDRNDIEYTDDGILHLPSNVNFTPTDGYMPEELRPDVGGDW
jgi:hypothetical protein